MASAPFYVVVQVDMILYEKCGINDGLVDDEATDSR